MKTVKEKREELKKVLSGDKNAIGDTKVFIVYESDDPDEETIIVGDGRRLTPEEVEQHLRNPNRNVIHIGYEPVEK